MAHRETMHFEALESPSPLQGALGGAAGPPRGRRQALSENMKKPKSPYGSCSNTWYALQAAKMTEMSQIECS